MRVGEREGERERGKVDGRERWKGESGKEDEGVGDREVER